MQLAALDRVASSNLASSSIKKTKPFGFVLFICEDRFEDLNAARMSAAGEGLSEPHLNPHTFPCADATESG